MYNLGETQVKQNLDNIAKEYVNSKTLVSAPTCQLTTRKDLKSLEAVIVLGNTRTLKTGPMKACFAHNSPRYIETKSKTKANKQDQYQHKI